MTAYLPWTGKRVFIVDDMESSRQRISDLFTSVGLSVVGSATNGVEALEKIPQLQPDLVSMDIIMPEMDGIECYRTIRRLIASKDKEDEKWTNETQYLFLSCLAGESKILSALENDIHATRLITKYPSSDDLIKILENVFAASEAKGNTPLSA